jgi:hypothetical protein
MTLSLSEVILERDPTFFVLRNVNALILPTIFSLQFEGLVVVIPHFDSKAIIGVHCVIWVRMISPCTAKISQLRDVVLRKNMTHATTADLAPKASSPAPSKKDLTSSRTSSCTLAGRVIRRHM